MKKSNALKRNKQTKQPFNMFVWGQRNKKVFAAIICFMLILGLLLSLVQV